MCRGRFLCDNFKLIASFLQQPVGLKRRFFLLFLIAKTLHYLPIQKVKISSKLLFHDYTSCTAFI